jgi:hypothetical protein
MSAGIQPNKFPISKNVNKLQTGKTKTIAAKVNDLSSAKRSDEIIAINFPELVLARLSTLRAVTLSKRTAHKVLRIFIEVM